MLSIIFAFLKGIPRQVWIALAIAGLCAALLWGAYHRGKLAERADWEAATQAQKAEAAQLLADETAKAKETEAKLTALKQKTESDHEKWKLENDVLSARVIALGERLRDPGRRPGSGSSETAAPGSSGQCGAGTETEGLLSAETSGFLRDGFREADATLDDLHACRAYALGLIEAWPR